MMTKRFRVYFVRHGETLFNTTRQVQGWSDSPLTPKGIEQAMHLHNVFSKIRFDQVYSSSSERACDTCEIILGHRNYERSKLFKEMNFGKLEGFVERRVGTYRKFEEIAQGYEDVDGESADHLNERIRQGLDYLSKQAKNEDKILVVTHGIYLMFLIAMFNDFTFLEFINLNKGAIANGSLTILDYEDGRYRMVCYNSLNYERILK